MQMAEDRTETLTQLSYTNIHPSVSASPPALKVVVVGGAGEGGSGGGGGGAGLALEPVPAVKIKF